MSEKVVKLHPALGAPTETTFRPIHLAHFYAWRRNVEDPRDWHQAMSKEFDTARREGFDYTYRFADESASIIYCGYSLEIDRENGMFWLHEDGAEFSDLPHGYPPNFIFLCGERSLPGPADHLAGVAHSLWLRMEVRFAAALKQGTVEIYARANTPLSERERILPDQWSWFEAKFDEDCDLGEPIFPKAVGPNGEVLFNPQFVIRSADAPPARTASDRRKDCTAALTTKIKAQPNRPMLKDEIYRWAKSEFGADFPKSEIETCRKRAISAVKPNTWDKPGRRT